MSADIDLKWEWPANRSVEQKLLVRVDNIKAQGGGLFGVLKSPSIADNLPDAQVITGKIVNTDESLDGKSFQLIAPKLEIERIKSNSYAVIGIVEDSICICIVPVETKDASLNSVSCP